MGSLIRSFLGPELYRVYKTDTTAGFQYVPNAMESWGDRIISFVRLFYKTTVWTSPLVGAYLLWRGYLSVDGAASLVRFAGWLGALAAGAAVLRAFGRMANPQYRVFMEVLGGDTTDPERRRQLAGYDFDMAAWPIDFAAQRVLEIPAGGETLTSSLSDEGLLGLPTRLLTYCVVHTIGRRLMYPGSIGFMRSLLAPALLEGRTRLVEELGGKRHALLARDGNRIDTMFVDRRRDGNSPNGKTLVICCEGNAGFYEIGATSAPLEAGYSVLGWNHPGFAGSSGVPLPESEQSAIAAVMEFAESQLGFRQQDTILYAWSIGGYTASWAAMTHPGVGGVVLDATFDDVLPLAVARMPPSWNSLVQLTCRRHLDLNNSRLLRHYPGPVLLIRRSQDEVITVTEGEVGTNRANDLLLQLMEHRFPSLLDTSSRRLLERWARGDAVIQAEVLSEAGVDDELCQSLLASYVSEHSASYPLGIGADMDSGTLSQLVIYLASRLMIEMEGTHCSPMSGSFFRLPWNLPQGTNGFVYLNKPGDGQTDN
ncbi:phosphatidylserine lipase ABHD16A-like [Amphibalanus amphitrite]|uniref:phosphatidylserine lipase ABHD16A-like n=1 Tax=Amphibalanus amphitrite TaxID=1232801 RepID=UPI001C924D44|nr:phosphatidylserine lipase ABHD16A-like [Amphibalanus amphitrite]